MDAETPKTEVTPIRTANVAKLGFAQFRFVIATILLLAAGLKTYQLATVPLPPTVQGSLFTPLLELFNNRWLLVIVIEVEILFASVLIVGFWRRWTWLASILCFFGFAIVSLIKAISGEGSCGCFGTVAVNPWITTVFDLGIVVLLCFFYERDKRFALKWSRKERHLLITAVSIWLILSIPTMWFVPSLKQSESSPLGKEFMGPMGKMMIQMEPSEWIGKEFPLFGRIDDIEADVEQLRHGVRKVVLIHADCRKCLHLLNELQEQKTNGVIVIEVPSFSVTPSPKTTFSLFRLDTKNDWFVTTPCIIELEDGICKKAILTP